MRGLRTELLMAIVVAGAIFVLPFQRLMVLGGAAGSEPHLKQFVLRSAKRLRSTAVLAPRLIQCASGWDGGRKRPTPAPAPEGRFVAWRSPGALRFSVGPAPRLFPSSPFPLRC